MATKPPGPPVRTPSKGEPPARQEIRDNLTKPEPGSVSTLNFRVPEDFKRDFRIAAASRGLSLTEFLEVMFSTWQKKAG